MSKRHPLRWVSALGLAAALPTKLGRTDVLQKATRRPTATNKLDGRRAMAVRSRLCIRASSVELRLSQNGLS
eukprot:CAMPEP_0183424984 /NCGR_PEP_ID=MMETSP0370-20130417/33834_1 /TAXON_ID=268820 /ORGANISM="Peridinium aciculiferum, Strain PAER-2" /LENGTH=71 /DNA_ID=CAMNT_0025609249 /DNA_START=20 /DNA_END=232 /DNA_ORIENTATION=-